MTDLTLRVCHLYPRLLSVAGDRGNLFALRCRCAWRDIGTEVHEVETGDTPDFTAFDVILFHGGQDKEMDVAARDLQAKGESLREAVENDVVILAVCAGYQLLGTYYQPSNGPRLEGIGALNVYTEGGAQRFMNHIALECTFSGDKPRYLVGFENHSGCTYLGEGVEPLGRVVAGSGNNGSDGTEGARYRQIYATYLHGPVLPKNTWFTDHLIAQGLRHRYGAIGPLITLADGAETRAHDAALKVALQSKGRRTALEATRW
ncbi:MAG TPA: glutamine amidotransferase [Chloroflexota bacterium]|nr:glutamine amidotransferase [Chloroflexota bacterium]